MTVARVFLKPRFSRIHDDDVNRDDSRVASRGRVFLKIALDHHNCVFDGCASSIGGSTRHTYLALEEDGIDGCDNEAADPATTMRTRRERVKRARRSMCRALRAYGANYSSCAFAGIRTRSAKLRASCSVQCAGGCKRTRPTANRRDVRES